MFGNYPLCVTSLLYCYIARAATVGAAAVIMITFVIFMLILERDSEINIATLTGESEGNREHRQVMVQPVEIQTKDLPPMWEAVLPKPSNVIVPIADSLLQCGKYFIHRMRWPAGSCNRIQHTIYKTDIFFFQLLLFKCLKMLLSHNL